VLIFVTGAVCTDSVPYLKSKYFAPPKLWAGYVTGSACFTLGWFKLAGICIRV